MEQPDGTTRWNNHTEQPHGTTTRWSTIVEREHGARHPLSPSLPHGRRHPHRGTRAVVQRGGRNERAECAPPLRRGIYVCICENGTERDARAAFVGAVPRNRTNERARARATRSSESCRPLSLSLSLVTDVTDLKEGTKPVTDLAEGWPCRRCDGCGTPPHLVRQRSYNGHITAI